MYIIEIIKGFLSSGFKSLGWQNYYLIGLGLICCVTDLKSGKIYNLVTYPSILAGFIFNGFLSERLSLIGFLVGFAPFAIASLKGLIGGGDAKLLGAVGAIGGFPYVLNFLFVTFLLASLFGLLVLIWKKRPLSELLPFFEKKGPLSPAETAQESAESRVSKKTRIPMGVFSLLGILLSIRGM